PKLELAVLIGSAHSSVDCCIHSTPPWRNRVPYTCQEAADCDGSAVLARLSTNNLHGFSGLCFFESHLVHQSPLFPTARSRLNGSTPLMGQPPSQVASLPVA